MWLGPTAKCLTGSRMDKTNCHYEFRWWYEYSGGKMTDWGAHHIDIAQWMLGDGRQRAGRWSSGSRPTKPYGKGDGYNCHRRLQGALHLPQRREVFAMSGREMGAGTTVKGLVDANGQPHKGRGRTIDGISGGENGVLVLGEKGTIFVSRGLLLASDKEILSEPLKEDPKLYPTRPTRPHGQLPRLRQEPRDADRGVEVGAGSVIVCHIGTIAHADRQEAEVGPEGTQVRRRRGQQDAQPRTPRRVED